MKGGQRVAELLEDVSQVESPPRIEGRHMIMLLSPKSAAGGQKKQKDDSGKKEEADEALANLAKSSSTGFGELAKFRLAASLAQKGDKAEATKYSSSGLLLKVNLH